MKKLIIFMLTVFYSINSYSQCGVYGKIRLVDYGEDVKVRVVNEFDATVNLKVKVVGDFGFSDEAGLWELVDIGEKFKVKLVDYGEDFTVQFVSNNWGCGNSSRHSGAYTNPKYIENNTAGTILSAIEKTEREMQQSRTSRNNQSPQPQKKWTKKQDNAFKVYMSIMGIGLIWALILGVQAA